ncbi:hypothetical protein KCP71_21865 [Salmonella enterica subsp. enterica]|nr:hypothetical protein KCP71_21865 [Salmonella enterica subsp. enterica]
MRSPEGMAGREYCAEWDEGEFQQTPAMRGRPYCGGANGMTLLLIRPVNIERQ